MSNPSILRKRMYSILTLLRMDDVITKREWELFKQVVDKGITSLVSDNIQFEEETKNG